MQAIRAKFFLFIIALQVGSGEKIYAGHQGQIVSLFSIALQVGSEVTIYGGHQGRIFFINHSLAGGE